MIKILFKLMRCSCAAFTGNKHFNSISTNSFTCSTSWTDPQKKRTSPKRTILNM